MPLTAHGEQSALRSHRTPNTAASTAPLPASVTIMIRPSGGVGCESSRFDLGQREQIFFGKSEIKDSTTNSPTGKSLSCRPDGAQRNPGWRLSARRPRISRSLSSGAHSRDPLAPSGLRLLLVAAGVPVHFLQKFAHCIELRAEAFPISGLQSLHRLIVAIERLPCLICRRAREAHFFCRA